ISVDSGQVYRGMDIGTAKPDRECRKRIPHHLIDIRDVTESYSAGQFRNDALSLIRSISAKGRIPLLAGGTMFYFSVLENGISRLPGADASVRARIDRDYDEKGAKFLHGMLGKADPVVAAAIDVGDTQRLKRALEILRITGQPPSAVMAKSRPRGIGFPIAKIALYRPRPILHRRIETRFSDMLEKGLVGEVEQLVRHLQRPESLASMRSVGYRQVIGFLQGRLSRDDLFNKGIAATRQLAKRQLTWLRNQSNVIWVDATCPDSHRTILEYLSESGMQAAGLVNPPDTCG
ncbi:MAG: tRNA (adenosine(37)-N6)-dimethylallyltransferase MiaA, partial [Gammaproteobacteria bacterium]|nr:tRNA (adenosine(37)-N6)-dimethylallyltransferase MiaA [Gammaproteobacteria bacterium]